MAKSPLYFKRLAQSMTGPNARTLQVDADIDFDDFSLAAVGGGSSHGLVDMGRTVWRFLERPFPYMVPCYIHFFLH